MSDITPRTDVLFASANDRDWVYRSIVELSRKIEIENAELRKQLEQAEKSVKELMAFYRDVSVSGYYTGTSLELSEVVNKYDTSPASPKNE